MTYAVTWEAPAVDLATRYLADDPDGLRAVFAMIDTLSDDPRPANAFPFGSTNLLRTRIGRYRVVYETHDTERTVTVMHIGRSA